MKTTSWAEYYRETEPKRRKEILEQNCETEADDGANAYREQLFEARHTDRKRPGHEVDLMLFMCVNFIQLYKSARMFRGSAVKEIRATMKELALDQADAYGEAGREARYGEMYNAAARYFKTCESPGYNRRLFGLTASGDEGRKSRMCRDAWQMSEGLAARTGMEAELAEWNRAVLDAFAATGGDARDAYQAYSRKMK